MKQNKNNTRRCRWTHSNSPPRFFFFFPSQLLLSTSTSPPPSPQNTHKNNYSQLLDPSTGTALGAAAANLAGGGLREASNLLKETGLGASFAEAGGAAAKAAVGALAAGANADVRTLPNPNGMAAATGGGSKGNSITKQESERHKELDRASEAIGSGRQQILGGGGGGGASIFSMMGTAPGAELTSAASAPKGYIPKPYKEDKGGNSNNKKEEAAASAGERSIGPFPVPNQPGTGGAGFDPQTGGGGGGGEDSSSSSFAPGAKSFPGSGDAPRASLYATNDAGTGPAPVSGGGFQPLESGGGFADGGKVMGGGGLGGGGLGGGGLGGGGGGGGGGVGGGKSATPLLGGGGGGGSSAPVAAGGSSVAPAPLVGGAVVGQDGKATLPVNSFAQQQQPQPPQQPPQQPQSSSSSSSSSNGGVGSDGLVHAPGGSASAPLGVVDTQPATTAVTGTAPGGLPFKMTIGRRRRRSRLLL